jgi:carbamoyltransferase
LLILGLNAFHGDSSACLVRDGQLIAAIEEERLRRVKHWAGFPSESIRYCLKEANATVSDLDIVAVNQDSTANFWRKVGYAIKNRPKLNLVNDRLRNRRARRGIVELLGKHFPTSSFRGQLANIDHHVAHLFSAFYVSPFNEATVVSVDGFGDFASAAWGFGNGSGIQVEGKIHFPHSLGIFYQALTQYLGFPYYGDEYKVMGLAPYGEPKYLDRMRDIVHIDSIGEFTLNLDYFKHHKEGVSYSWDNGVPAVGPLFTDALEDLLGSRRALADALDDRHRDIARSTQAMYEEAFFALITPLQERHGCDTIALAGGCAMNSVANGKIRRRTNYDRVYIQSAAGDAGGAIGAAYAAWHSNGGSRNFVMDHAYWGPEYDANAIDTLLSRKQVELEQAGCTIQHIKDEDELCRITAEAISRGEVVGWFQGRMEWGPRALGNRSIVCDPRRGDMKDILNAKIKRRESFRPFAPSVLEEEVGSWFEEEDAVPFMMQVFQIREEKRSEIPAVTHVDGSGRLQTVSNLTNARYHRLISWFGRLTGVPMVLNTSFNENEPVVCKPEEALNCFLRTQMDRLVLGEVMVTRTSGPVRDDPS